MTQPEARLQRKIQDALKVEGWFVFKIHGSEYQMAGLPDLIVCAEGYFIGLEVKMPSARANTSARQDYVHELIREAKGAVAVVCSVQEALQFVQVYLEMKGIGL